MNEHYALSRFRRGAREVRRQLLHLHLPPLELRQQHLCHPLPRGPPPELSPPRQQDICRSHGLHDTETEAGPRGRHCLHHRHQDFLLGHQGYTVRPVRQLLRRLHQGHAVELHARARRLSEEQAHLPVDMRSEVPMKGMEPGAFTRRDGDFVRGRASPTIR